MAKLKLCRDLALLTLLLVRALWSNQTLVTTKEGTTINRNDSLEAVTKLESIASIKTVRPVHVLEALGVMKQTQLQARNYFELFRTGYFPTNNASSIVPLELLYEHIEDYSQQRLEQMWRDCGDKRCESFDTLTFVVGHYSCPIEAGNRIFKMLNSLLWAVVTQRVMLWDYWDHDACVDDIKNGRCELNGTLNTPEDCEEILRVSDWVPSWDEWSRKLNLTQPVKACAVGSPKRGFDRWALPMDGHNNIPRVIKVGQQVNMEPGLIMMGRDAQKFRNILSGRQARINAKAMFENGLYFGYGMLFESLFSLHASLLPDLVYDADAVDTYVLHSRHRYGENNGSDMQMDISCMEKMLTNRSTDRPCVVYSMTDRAQTRELLPDALSKFDCVAVFSTNTTQSTSWRDEHGPYAGRGYYQDLALVRNARRGILAPNPTARPRVGIRTSTALARSLIEFRRILESPPGAAPEFEECYTL